MSKLLIRFAYTHHDTGLVAHADVPVAEGVYVTGWRIYRTSKGEVIVAPPSVPTEKPDGTLERKVFVEFTEEGVRAKWLERIRAQFVGWDEEQKKRAEKEEPEKDMPF